MFASLGDASQALTLEWLFPSAACFSGVLTCSVLNLLDDGLWSSGQGGEGLFPSAACFAGVLSCSVFNLFGDGLWSSGQGGEHGRFDSEFGTLFVLFSSVEVRDPDAMGKAFCVVARAPLELVLVVPLIDLSLDGDFPTFLDD